MTKLLILSFVAIMAVAAFGVPAEEEEQFEALPLDSELAVLYGNFDAMMRESRISCLFGAAVCIAHCKLKGFKSGYCSNKVCHCTR